MKNLISVIVTCYNHEKYIEQCLRSVFKQTYQNIELIVLDDGSTDGSKQIILKTLKDSPFEVKFESHKNMGVVKTRNKGIEKIFLVKSDMMNIYQEKNWKIMIFS